MATPAPARRATMRALAAKVRLSKINKPSLDVTSSEDQGSIQGGRAISTMITRRRITIKPTAAAPRNA